MKQTRVVKLFIDLIKVDLEFTRSRSPYVEGTIPNTAMKPRMTFETRPGAVLHIDVAEMSVVSVGGARDFVTFTDEASKNVSVFHMKTKNRGRRTVGTSY